MTDSTAGHLTRREVASQPDCWRRALALAEQGLPGLPQRGERLLVLGCGTSYYAGLAYATVREASGAGPGDALVASEIPPAFRRYDRVLAISRSGTSSELIAAVAAFRRQQPGTPVTALLGEQGTPLAGLADHIVDLSFADEESVVQTRFPTTQLVLLRAALGAEPGEALARLPGRAEQALAGPVPAADVTQVVFLASGWGVALAQEAALKVRESSGGWVESYPVGEYRHGPIAACGEGTLVWGFDRLPEDIVEVVLTVGGRIEHGGGEPLVELVRAHRFALDLAAARGRDADRPLLLSRSVVL